jgi:hypothetical protein
MACTFAWQSCLIQAAIIPANSREGTPVDLLLFLFGLLLGVPVYSALTYAAGRIVARTEQIVGRERRERGG